MATKTYTPFSKLTAAEMNLYSTNLGLREVLEYTSGTSTFTKSSYEWLRAIRVTCVGGGGGGGGAGNGGSGENAGSGGGGGAFAQTWISDISTVATAVTVVAGTGGAAGSTSGGDGGNGGSSYFGTHASAVGGNGGLGTATLSTATAKNLGGTWGTADVLGTGDIIIGGTFGGNYVNVAGVTTQSGDGGASQLAPTIVGRTTTGTGRPGASYGGGGAGGFNTGATGRAGGAGAAGIVIVELYS